MSELILHHYDPSPFSEKVRLLLGRKGLAWRSVIVPMVLPKPDLMPLTGGFRRTPVLQVGADVYCDTQCIADALERMVPQPTLYPAGRGGLNAVLVHWAERVLFGPTARFVTAAFPQHLPPGLHADRAAMRGHAPPDPATFHASAALARRQVHQQLPWAEEVLGDGRRFLLGAQVALADYALYGRTWWLGALDPRGRAELEPYPHLRTWAGQVAAGGHGTRREMAAAEALAVAREAAPTSVQPHVDPDEAPLRAGSQVQVATEGYGPDPTRGELVRLAADGITVRRSDPAVGTVHVHFPRLGYDVTPAGPPHT